LNSLVPKEIDDIFKKAVARKREDRFTRIDDLNKALMTVKSLYIEKYVLDINENIADGVKKYDHKYRNKIDAIINILFWKRAFKENRKKSIIGIIGCIVLAAYSLNLFQKTEGTQSALMTIGNKKEFDQVTSIAFSPDSTHGLAAVYKEDSKDKGRITLINISKRKPVKDIKGFSTPVFRLSFTSDGKYIVSGHFNGVLNVWDSSGNAVRSFQAHEGPVSCIKCLPNTSYVVTSGTDASIRIWNIYTGEMLKSINNDYKSGGTTYLSVSSDGHYLAYADAFYIKIFDAFTGNMVCKISNDDACFMSIAFSPDNKNLLTGDDGKLIKLWDISTQKIIKEFRGHKSWVRFVSFSPDGKNIISASNDKSIIVWDVETGKIVSTRDAHMDWVTATSLSPDGKHILSGSLDGTIKLWNSGM
jgi:WD40 repeat protein